MQLRSTSYSCTFLTHNFFFFYSSADNHFSVVAELAVLCSDSEVYTLEAHVCVSCMLKANVRWSKRNALGTQGKV